MPGSREEKHQANQQAEECRWPEEQPEYRASTDRQFSEDDEYTKKSSVRHSNMYQKPAQW